MNLTLEKRLRSPEDGQIELAKIKKESHKKRSVSSNNFYLKKSILNVSLYTDPVPFRELKLMKR